MIKSEVIVPDIVWSHAAKEQGAALISFMEKAKELGVSIQSICIAVCSPTIATIIYDGGKTIPWELGELSIDKIV